MRLIALFCVGAMAACASMKVPYPDAQAVIDGVAKRHEGLVRLTLHAVPEGSTECTQVASTMASRRGKKSDPEDIKAMRTGQEVVMDESGAVDVTVPILIKGGSPTAIVGVTLRPAKGADRATTVSHARAIAREVAAEVAAADKPLW
jgi:hypothetical protein